MSFDCTDKQALLQDDRDGVQYQYGTELSEWVGSGGLNAGLGGWQPINHLSVYGTANTQYWTARGKGQASYRLGTLPNGGANNRWKIDVDITRTASLWPGSSTAPLCGAAILRLIIRMCWNRAWPGQLAIPWTLPSGTSASPLTTTQTRTGLCTWVTKASRREQGQRTPLVPITLFTGASPFAKSGKRRRRGATIRVT